MKQVSLSQLHEQEVPPNPAIRKKVMLQAGELSHFTQTRFAPGQVATTLLTGWNLTF